MAVQARTLEFYRQLGISDEVVAAGFQLDLVHLRNRSRELAVIRLGDVGGGISPFPFALSLPQDDHERLLTARLHAAGHAVEWDTELTGVSQRDDGVTATLRKPGGEETWDGAYLCGCDGAHSAVRHGLASGSRAGRMTSPSTSPTPRRRGRGPIGTSPPTLPSGRSAWPSRSGSGACSA